MPTRIYLPQKIICWLGLLLAILALSSVESAPPTALAAGSAGQVLQPGGTAKQAPGAIGVDRQIHTPRPAGIVLEEDFEGGAVPPAGWTQLITNASFPTTTWNLRSGSASLPGEYSAQVQYDPSLVPQDEWLLSPELNIEDGTLSFWSFGSVYWCRDTYDNCHLEAWVVVDEVGGADDVYLGLADEDWPTSWTWAQSVFDLGSALPGGPVRLGFRYVGLDGAQVALDDISLETSGDCDPAYGADFFWVPISPTTGQWVTFSGHASGTQPLDYNWTWGDGHTGSGATAAHMYAEAGDYSVQMTATNACGASLASHMLTVATSTVSPYYAFVNQPWDWVEGLAAAESTVQATLRRSDSPIASANATSDAEGFFALEFRDANGHVDIQVGDEIVLSGGEVDGTIVVVDTYGGIDVAEDTVVGQVSGGEFPAQGTAWLGYATARNFMVEPVAIDENGFFLADFGGQVDVDDDHVAKVVYQDPQGNEVVQVFYPGGLDVRTLISEDRIEGVAAPSTTVRALVADADGPKGTGDAVTDETGFYSMQLYDRGYPVDLRLGDRITVTKAGRTRQVELGLYHVTHIQTWNSRIDGTVLGLALPAEGTEGRVDVWSAVEKRWYTQYVGIAADGSYGADFADLLEMTSADVIRLWVTLPDGTQQAALGWPLHVGVSTSDNTVWGFSTVSSTAQITLYRGLEDGAPVDVIGTASATVDKRGYFSTTILVEGTPQDIMPSNVLMVQAGEHARTVFVGLVDLVADVDNDAVLVLGPAGSVAHVEGRRHGVLREDAPYQESYGWAQGTVGPNGKAVLGPLPFDVQVDDWFDVTCYLVEEGIAIHRLIAVPEETISIMMVYLPLTFKHAQP
ncbi:MAG: choice-of-anchor J domain-containing protein [Chloroflexia bacterium]|nr:choice-of-anchor J domain-containing protein [Chloroflexia bacterium]